MVCDHVDEHLRHIQGGYDDMYKALLHPLECRVYFACNGEFPDHPEECDVWLVGGSKYSVYDDIEWIRNLKKFIGAIYDTGSIYIGICFGHQMLAYGLDGDVRKASQGWCLGSHSFNICVPQPWMKPYRDSVDVLMLCQDQVTKLPSSSVVLASSRNCPVAMYLVGDRMLGIQGHPEFSIEYQAAIIASRRERLGEDSTNAALTSLGKEIHHDLMTQWILTFIQQYQNDV